MLFQPYNKNSDADSTDGSKQRTKKSMEDSEENKKLATLEQNFLSSGRTGRRNALIVSDVTDPRHSKTSTADLPSALAALSATSSSKSSGKGNILAFDLCITSSTFMLEQIGLFTDDKKSSDAATEKSKSEKNGPQSCAESELTAGADT